MNHEKALHVKKGRRARRVRARVKGSALVPRLSVFRSNRFIYAQLIDDAEGKTLASVSSKDLGKVANTEQAGVLGEAIAKKASSLGVKKAVFDRGSYRYHGRVKALAEAARKGGLAF